MSEDATIKTRRSWASIAPASALAFSLKKTSSSRGDFEYHEPAKRASRTSLAATGSLLVLAAHGGLRVFLGLGQARARALDHRARDEVARPLVARRGDHDDQ